MKLLAIDPFLFKKGFKFACIDKKGEWPEKFQKIEYINKILEKYVNNDYDLSAPINDKLSHLFFSLEYFASEREPEFNPYFTPKYTFEELKETSPPEAEFFKFFINILNSLVLSYTGSDDFNIGKLDKLLDTLSDENGKFRRKELTIIQKYVIIARLLYCFLNEIGIKDKSLFNISFHYLVMRFIDKSEAEANFLNNDSKKRGILVSRGSIFLSSFRTPASAEEIQNIYTNIKKLYQDPEPLAEFYQKKAWERYLLSRRLSPSPKRDRSNKIWTKSFFLKNIKKYKNQSEFAKALGISTQRVSFMKQKLKISQKDIINFRFQTSPNIK